jgi:hypothetical protein
MTPKEFLKLGRKILDARGLLRHVSACARGQLPSNSAYERMKRLRINYIRAAGNPQKRFAINREIIALAFEMRDAGASRQHIMTIGQKSLYAARHEHA